MFAEMDSLHIPLMGMALVAAALAVWRDRVAEACSRSEAAMSRHLQRSEQDGREAEFHLANARGEIADLRGIIKAREEDVAYAQQAHQDAERRAVELSVQYAAELTARHETERRLANLSRDYAERNERMLKAERSCAIEKDARRTAEQRLAEAERALVKLRQEAAAAVAKESEVSRKLADAEIENGKLRKVIGDIRAIIPGEEFADYPTL